MGKNSSIEWTHHTFNPWWGCLKVSPACKHCYAETWARRVGQQVWGSNAPRRFFTEAHWKEPLRWNAEAAREGERRRVFCASMADVFEARKDLDPWRIKLWAVIELTPHLDWLLLTKRPQNAQKMTPWETSWPENVWLGVTVETQKYADIRLPILTSIPAKCRFLSCEPLLGPLDLKDWLPNKRWRKSSHARTDHFIDWIIAGGESGPGARPMNPDWPRGLRDQCLKAGVPFHFKQWGHWAPSCEGNSAILRQLVVESNHGPVRLVHLPKKLAGRMLDGREWDGVPIMANQ